MRNLNISLLVCFLSFSFQVSGMWEDVQNALLRDAIVDHDIEKARELIKKGANVNSMIRRVDINNTVPILIYTIQNNRPMMAHMLIESPGIDLNCCDAEGNTPLHIALKNNDIGFVNLLCDKGADVNAKNRFGAKPWDELLSPAIFSERKGLADILIKVATLEVKDVQSGDTLLHDLLRVVPSVNSNFHLVPKYEPILEALLERKDLAINTLNKEGRTPLDVFDCYACSIRLKMGKGCLQEFKDVLISKGFKKASELNTETKNPAAFSFIQVGILGLAAFFIVCCVYKYGWHGASA